MLNVVDVLVYVVCIPRSNLCDVCANLIVQIYIKLYKDIVQTL